MPGGKEPFQGAKGKIAAILTMNAGQSETTRHKGIPFLQHFSSD